MRKLLLFILFLNAALIGFAQEIFDMPGATNTYLMGINDSGEICGYYTDGGGTYHGFEINKYGDTILLLYPNSQYCIANNINNQGMVVGDYNTTGVSSDDQSYIFFPLPGRGVGGTYVNISAGWGAMYNSCTDLGEDTCIAGSFHNGNNDDGVLWCHTYSTENDLRCTNRSTVYTTYAFALDKFSNVGGYIIQGAQEQAFVYRAGVWDTFMVAGALKSRVYGMNDKGWICGNFNYQTEGFIGQKFANQPLSNLTHVKVNGAVNIYPRDINNNNQVVGYYEDATGQMHGFIISDYDIGFRPSRDGYAFTNIDAWPSSYWSGISYHTDPYLADGSLFPRVGEDGTLFINAKSYPTWSDFVHAYSEQQCYKLVNGHKIILRQIVGKWDDFRTLNYGGACFGMSGTALMNFDSLPWYNQRFTASIPSETPTVFGYPSSVPVLSAVHQTQSMQCSVQLRNDSHAHTPDYLTYTLNSLKSNLRDSRGRPHCTLSMADQHGDNSHCLIPYRLVTDKTGLQRDTIYIYDCNFPGQDNLYIATDLSVGSHGSWTYTANDQMDHDWGSKITGQGLWVHFTDSIYKDILTPALPQAQSPVNTRSVTTSFITACFNDSAILQVTDDSGSVALFGDSVSGTTLIQPNYYLTGGLNGSYVRSLFSLSSSNAVNKTSSDSADFFSITQENYRIRCDRFVYTNTTDKYAFSPGSLTYLTTTQSDSIAYTVNVTDSNNEYNYYITNLNVPAANKVTVTTYGNNGMVLQNFGPPTTYTITTEFITDSLHTFTDIIPIGGNTQHIIQPHDTTFSGIYILVDTGMMGHYEDTIFITQTITGINKINAPDINAWPVPSGNELYMSGPQGMISYTLVDVMGRTIAKGQLDFGNKETRMFDLTNLVPGYYVIQGHGKTENWNYTFIKQ